MHWPPADTIPPGAFLILLTRIFLQYKKPPGTGMSRAVL